MYNLLAKGYTVNFYVVLQPLAQRSQRTAMRLRDFTQRFGFTASGGALRVVTESACSRCRPEAV